MKGLIISMLVFICTTAIMSLTTGLLAKSRKKWKAEAVKWKNSYNNLLELHEKNMEVISDYEKKENNIEPTADSYNSVVSDWNNKSNRKKTTK